MQRSDPPHDLPAAEAHSRLYTLRLWRAQPGAPWQAALRSADGVAPRRFADLEALAMYLLDLADGDILPDGDATRQSPQ